MVRQNRPGLTLVEVVVLIVLIGFLLVLLASWLGSRRDGGGRRGVCMNNQKQLTLAIQQYEAARGRLPGYVNRLARDEGGQPVVCSWIVPLLPYLERSDLYRRWRSGSPTPVFLRLLVCPSDPPDDTGAGATPLSFVVNCGLPGDEDGPADGLFFNHDVDGEPVTTSFDYVSEHDGTATTLLLSENIQAGKWTDKEEANLGMVWHREPDECSPINACLDAGDRPQDVRYARPSSYHSGGVIVSFCDGHQYFLREDIDYRVYQHLMTPDSAAAGVPGELKESEY